MVDEVKHRLPPGRIKLFDCLTDRELAFLFAAATAEEDRTDGFVLDLLRLCFCFYWRLFIELDPK